MFVVNDLEKYGVHMLEIINEIMRINFKNYQDFKIKLYKIIQILIFLFILSV